MKGLVFGFGSVQNSSITAQLANYILLHAYPCTTAISNYASTNKIFIGIIQQASIMVFLIAI